MSGLDQAIVITVDHVAMLRAVDQAGGSMALGKLVEVLTPGVMSAPTEEFGCKAIHGARIAGELRRWGMLERLPLSTRRELTAAGRAVLAEHVQGGEP